MSQPSPGAPSRAPDSLREITIERGVSKYPEGSALISFGDTKVLCTASVDDVVPPFLAHTGTGWVTAEYNMLPRATSTRKPRPRLKPDSRGIEIQRLIGRSLRQAVDLTALGEHTIIIDCDVLQADGGTRTAAITGGMIALYDALRWMVDTKRLASLPIRNMIAAVSVGLIGGQPYLDLDYALDSRADVDFNFVMDDACRFIEMQGTAEKEPFTPGQLNQLITLATAGITTLIAIQKSALGL